MRLSPGPILRMAALCGTLAAAALAAAGPAAAHGYKLGAIAVGHVWAPPPAPGADGVAVYGPILNGGAAPARLERASSPIADEVRFRTEKDGTVSWVPGIDLRPGKPVALAPWREHIWLSGLKRPVEAGGSFPLTLDFGPAGTLDVEVVVESKSGH